MSFYQLPESLQGEVQDFSERIEEYQKGELSPIAFKGIRVGHGVYEQRKPETHMVRIRCAAGGVTPEQLRKVGLLAKKYGSGEIHVTTRQEMQLHYVDLEHVIPITNDLIKEGLSSRGGGGNTIRNIMSSHDSGIAKGETFDVTPYAVALTTRMIAEADSWNLPRKFKIAFSNSDQDTIRATVTCLGFIAKIQDGQKGFAVYVAGGMGAKPMPGHLLFDWVPEDRVYYITRAMKVMFDRYGNRRRRTLARIKFLWEKLGEFEFRNKFYEAYDEISIDEHLALELPIIENKAEVKEGYQPVPVTGPAFELWKKRYATEQKQEGLYHIEVPLKLGDIPAADAVRIADVLSNFGENSMRFSVYQNVYFRNIPEAYLGNIYQLILSIESLAHNPSLFGKMVACTGADTCKLGIALPRGATPIIQELLLESGLDLDLLSDVKIHISGCPNTCGCHHAADLGFFGKVMRSGKDMLPAYNVLAGAIMEEGNTRFTRKLGEVPAKDLPNLIKDVLRSYVAHIHLYPSFAVYVDDRGEADIVKACETYTEIPSFADRPDYFTDWGAADRFTVLKGQKAECSAGLFDMIDVDRKTARSELKRAEALADGNERLLALKQALLTASRMLLVTRGIEAKTETHVFDSFLQHFIRTDLISDNFTPLIEAGRAQNDDILRQSTEQIAALVSSLEELYKNMDDSLRFKSQPKFALPV